jgi:two-component system CheB/CheR fusion protein
MANNTYNQEHQRSPTRDRTDDKALPPHAQDDLDSVLALVHARQGLDFRHYKRRTLGRRIERRMGLKYTQTLSEYLELLRQDDDEIERLCRDLMIGVTQFFRDPEVFQLLASQVIHPLVRWANPNASLRIWVPGCATGEEAYSLAILLFEQMREQSKEIKVQIIASDIDTRALEIGRAGVYPVSITADIPHPLLSRAFVKTDDDHYAIQKPYRESVLFAKQNLISDPPFSKLDLISCRNLLIYLQPQLQEWLIRVFHFALKPGGSLLLGNSETVGSHSDLFEPISKQWRFYRRQGTVARLPLSFPMVSPRRQEDPTKGKAASDRTSARLADQAPRWISEAFAPATVLINQQHETLFFHGDVMPYLTIPSGEPNHNLLDMLREGIATPVRSAVRQALRNRQPVEIDRVQVKRPEGWVPISVRVVPIEATPETEALCLVAFSDLREPSSTSANAGAPAVQSRDDLVRQLEEELRLSKEELQSTIEEMETSKEELQSLNEELTVLNRQLEGKVAELEQASDDIHNLLVSTHVATLFLDTAFCIKRYTPASTELFSLMPADVGRPLQDIHWKFTDATLLADAQQVLDTLAPLEKQVQDEASRWFIRRILPYRTSNHRINGVVVTLTDITSWRRTETQAREQLAQLEAIYDSAPVGLSVVDAELRYIRISDRLAALNGLTPAEHLGKHIREVLPSDLADSVEPHYRHVLNTGEPMNDLELRGATFGQPGAIRDWLVSYRPLNNADGVVFGVSTMVQDVTSRKQTERRLATARAVAQTLIASQDFETAVPEILDTFTRTFGADICELWMPNARGTELVCTAFRSPHAPEQRAQFKELFDNMTLRPGEGLIGQVWHDQTPRWVSDVQQDPDFRRLDEAMQLGITSGFVFPILTGARRIGVMSFFTRERLQADENILGTLSAIGWRIGEFVRRSRAEQALRESEDRFRSIMLEAPIPMMTHTLDELINLNAAFTQLTGYTVEDIPTSQDWFRKGLRLPADQVEAAVQRLVRRLEAGPPFHEKEVSIWTKAGARRSWLFQVSEANRLPDGRPFFVTMAVDITERKQVEVMVREADRRKTDFLAILGHELRNPIAAIAHGIETIEMAPHEAETDPWTMGMIRQQINQVVSLLDDLLDMTRINQGRIELKKEIVSLPAAIDQAVATIRPLIDERHHTLTLTPTADVVLEADPTRLQQIVINLLSNAAQYTAEGGHIQLHTNLEDEEVVIRVVDDGVGLSTDMQARLFEPFSQPIGSPSQPQGAGLGLALVWQLTALHGGRVTASSEGSGQGSEFVVRLPVRSGVSTETLPKPSSPSRREPPPGLQVLIVDDNVSSTRALARILRRRGQCEVAVAHDGESALAAAHVKPPQIVLLDIGLPDMSGYELARKFREEPQLASALLIAVTGYGHEEARQASREAGIDEHIAKPIRTATLLELLADWGEAG